MSMSVEEAIRILDPKTSADAIKDIEEEVDYDKNKVIAKIEEASILACDIMREYLSDKEICKNSYDDLKEMSKEQLIKLFLKIKKAFNKISERCAKLEEENIALTDLDKLIDSIEDKRKTQCYEDTGEIWNYFIIGVRNPCGCGSNCFHYEYDGKKIYGVCNACNTDIYELNDEKVEIKLKCGIWK